MLTLADQLTGYQTAAHRTQAEAALREETAHRKLQERRARQGTAAPTKARDRSRERAKLRDEIDCRIIAAISRIRLGTRGQIIAAADIGKSVGYDRIQHLVEAGKIRIVGSCKTQQILGLAA